MKEKIEGKIHDLIDYITNKPIEEVTLDDYTVLTNELAGIRNAEAKADQGKRMAELMAMAGTGFAPAYGSVN